MHPGDQTSFTHQPSPPLRGDDHARHDRSDLDHSRSPSIRIAVFPPRRVWKRVMWLANITVVLGILSVMAGGSLFGHVIHFLSWWGVVLAFAGLLLVATGIGLTSRAMWARTTAMVLAFYLL